MLCKSLLDPLIRWIEFHGPPTYFHAMIPHNAWDKFVVQIGTLEMIRRAELHNVKIVNSSKFQLEGHNTFYHPGIRAEAYLYYLTLLLLWLNTC